MINGEMQDERLGCYIKLNVGGSLFHTTISTLVRANTMLKTMFSGRMEVKTDDQGWVLIDRSGKHFGKILDFLRDGTVPLPDNRCELEELLIEAKFFCIEDLKVMCEAALAKIRPDHELQYRACIIIVKCPQSANKIIKTASKPVVKLTMNRYNNVFSYTTNSHDNLLRNIECLEKYALMFGNSVLFIKDVKDKSEQNEICEWSYYYRGYKLKNIDCIAIHYSSDKRLTKVEFPESRIHEEMLFLISYSTHGVTDADLESLEIRKGSNINSQPTHNSVDNNISEAVSITNSINNSLTIRNESYDAFYDRRLNFESNPIATSSLNNQSPGPSASFSQPLPSTSSGGNDKRFSIR